MSETLTMRSEEKAQWERAAPAVKETGAEYVRNAVRQRGQSSLWEKHIGFAKAMVPPPTNRNIRRAFAQHRRRRRCSIFSILGPWSPRPHAMACASRGIRRVV
jgi:hypothetical protein